MVKYMQAPKPADKAAKPTDLKSLNVRQYLEATVVQVLMKGMQVSGNYTSPVCYGAI